MISSTKNPKVQWIRRLQDKRSERQSEGVIVLEGVRLLEEAVKASWIVKYLVYSEELSDRGRALVDELVKINVQTEVVSSHVMRAVSDTKNSACAGAP
jgi:TrmH family RNA methyltransferase